MTSLPYSAFSVVSGDAGTPYAAGRQSSLLRIPVRQQTQTEGTLPSKCQSLSHRRPEEQDGAREEEGSCEGLPENPVLHYMNGTSNGQVFLVFRKLLCLVLPKMFINRRRTKEVTCTCVCVYDLIQQTHTDETEGHYRK